MVSEHSNALARDAALERDRAAHTRRFRSLFELR